MTDWTTHPHLYRFVNVNGRRVPIRQMQTTILPNPIYSIEPTGRTFSFKPGRRPPFYLV